MESQDQKKAHSSSGHEGHGVHLCRKCGWPFPNPHPSAKHRRAHRRVCGKLDGYLLVGSDENPHLNVSDDEHSDDDHNTPGPKGEEGSQVKLGKSATAERSISVEEEVFSDAVTNFLDGGLSTQSEGLLHDDESVRIARKIPENDPAVEVSGESATAEVIPQDPHLTGSSTKEKYAASGVMNEKLSSENSIQDLFTSPAISGQEQPAEKFSDLLNDKQNRSVPDSSLLQPEAPVESLTEVETTTDREMVKAFSEDSISGENDVKLDKETTSSQEPCKDEKEISGVMPIDGGFKMGKSGDILFSEVSPSGLAPDLSSEQPDVSADMPDETVDKAQEFELSVPENPVDSHAKTLGESGNFHVLTVPKDIPVVEHAEKFIEDFKDHKGNKVLQTDGLGSAPTICQKEDDIVSASEDFSSPKLKVQEEVAEVPSDVYISETSSAKELEIPKPVDEDAPLQSDVILSRVIVTTHETQGLNEVEIAGEALTTAVEESNVAVKAEKMEPKYIVNSSSQIEVPVDDVKSSSGLNEVAGETEVETAREALTTPVEDSNVAVKAEKMEQKDVVNSSSQIEVPLDDVKLSARLIEVETAREASTTAVEDSDVVVKAEKMEQMDVVNSSSQIEVPVDDVKSSARLTEVEIAREALTTGVEDSNVVVKAENMEQKDVVNSSSQIEVPVDDVKSSARLTEVETAREALTTGVEESNVVVKAEKMEQKDLVNNSSQIEVPVDDVKSSSGLKTVVALVDTEVRETSGITSEVDSTNNVICIVETPCTVGDAERKQNMDESFVESQIIPESTGMQSIVQDDMINSEGDVCCDQKNNVKENLDASGTDVVEGHVLGNNIKEENAAECTSMGSRQGCDDTAENVIHCQETKSEILYGASNTKESSKEGEKSCDVEIQGACNAEVSTSMHELSHDGDARIQELTSEKHHEKENLLSTAMANTVTSDVTVPGLSSPLQDEGDETYVEQQLAGSVNDTLVDSSSRADSLECNWGSLSVLSTQSDPLAAMEPDVFPTKDPQSMTDAAKSNLKLEKTESGGKNLENTDVFEPPSFMTLVNPTNNQNPAISVQNSDQSKSASEQAGWFPSLAHAANDSQGRKKNEEIITKVTNWSVGKQHSPLKSLLVEANRESKLKSVSPKESSAPIFVKDDDTAKDNNKNTMSTTTVSSLLDSSEAVDSGAAAKEMDQEWNSPARYPTDIKREKRKVKGRPYWAQFVCCSSVN